MKKEIFTGIIGLCLGLLLCIGCVSTQDVPEPTEDPTEAITLAPTAVPIEEKSTPEPTVEPTEEPTQTPEPVKETGPQVGEFWMEVPEKPITQGTEFSTKILLNTGNQKIAAYGLNIAYDSSVIVIDTAKSNSGVEPGSNGFIAAVNTNSPGNMFVAGFDVYGAGPGAALHMVTIYWKAVGKGISEINFIVKNLVDETVNHIGVKKGRSTQIEVK